MPQKFANGRQQSHTRFSVRGRGRPAAAAILICLLLTAAAAVGLFWLSADRELPRTDRPDNRVTAQVSAISETRKSRDPGYIGPDSCVACHRERVLEFRRTNHFRTCRVPRADELPVHFSAGRYKPRFPGTSFEMTRRGSDFFQTTVLQHASGEHRMETRIDLVLGAGQTDDIYVSWRDDGQMFELPIAWLWSQDCWGSSHFLTKYGTADYSRAMTVRCMECHNTWLEHEPGTVNSYQHDTAILGITCERCHGPGKAHVEFHRSRPQAVEGAEILKPSDLTRERLIEVCTQCHSNAIVHREAPFTYRPGQPLDQFFRTLLISRSEDQHVANQIDSLRQSRCFEASPSMTCITCHDPHRQRASGESPSSSCQQCHQPNACQERPRLPANVQDDCVGCHMPQRIRINVKFETEGDNFVPATRRFQHQVAVDPIARDEVLLRWHQSMSEASDSDVKEHLTSRLILHWTSLAEQHRNQRRYLAAIADYREALAVSDTPELRAQLQDVISIQTKLYDDWAGALQAIAQNRTADAIDILESLLRDDPRNAEVRSKLGTLYAMTGRFTEAIPHLEAVASLDPNDGSGYGVLGRVEWQKGRFSAALEYWQQAEVLDPYNAQIQFDIGLALERLNRCEESLQSLERATEIAPGRNDIQQSLQRLRLKVSGKAE